jgi:hypothetical protein
MKKNMTLGFRIGFKPVFDEAADKAAADAKATSDAAAAKKAEDDAAAANDPIKRLNFTPEQQEFMNRKIADEKRAMQAQNSKTIEDLKKLQSAQGTSEAQKKELQDRINELQRQYLSKEEIAKQEQERVQREYQATLKAKESEAEKWQRMFHETTITRSLQDGAMEFEAFNPHQIIDLLQTKTKLVDETDTDGNKTGRMIPRVSFADQDTDGKPVTLDLSVKEALTRMKNTPNKYGNLFKSTLAGGIGQNGNGAAGGGAGKGGKPDFSKMTPTEWMDYKKKNPTLTGV